MLCIQIWQCPGSTLVREPAFKDIATYGFDDDTISRTQDLVAFNQHHTLFTAEVVITQQTVFFHQSIVCIKQCRNRDKRISRADENCIFRSSSDFQVIAARQNLIGGITWFIVTGSIDIEK